MAGLLSRSVISMAVGGVSLESSTAFDVEQRLYRVPAPDVTPRYEMSTATMSVGYPTKLLGAQLQENTVKLA